MHTYFALKKWWMHYFDDVIKCHTLVCTWSVLYNSNNTCGNLFLYFVCCANFVALKIDVVL